MLFFSSSETLAYEDMALTYNINNQKIAIGMYDGIDKLTTLSNLLHEIINIYDKKLNMSESNSDKIVINKIYRGDFKVVKELSPSERSTGGFGSTGKL